MIYPHPSKILQRHRIDDERGLRYHWGNNAQMMQVMRAVMAHDPPRYMSEPALAIQDEFSVALHQAQAVQVSLADMAQIGPHDWNGQPVWLEFERPQSFGSDTAFEGALIFRLPLPGGHFVLPVLMGKSIEWPLPFVLNGPLPTQMADLPSTPADQAGYTLRQILSALTHVPPLPEAVPQHEPNSTLLARLERHLKRTSECAPQTARRLPQQYLKHRSRWSNHTFVPTPAVAALLLAHDGMNEHDAILTAPEVALVTAWRYAKHVIRIDEDVLDSLRRSKPLKVIPHELPGIKSHALYVPVPGGLNTPHQTGFFVGIDQVDEQLRLLLLIDQRTGGDNLLAPISLPLGANIEQELTALAQEGGTNFRPEDARSVAKDLGFALLCVAYLGSPNTQLLGIGQPKPTTTRKLAGGREELAEPGQVPIWEAGVDIGEKLRAYKVRRAQQSAVGGTQQGSSSGFVMPPHLRAPHPHGYWVGEGRRRFELKFVDFVPVNMDNPEEGGEAPVRLD